MEFFAIITLQIMSDRGIEQMSFTETVTVNATAKRSEIYEYMRRSAVRNYGSRWGNAVPVFFSAEPNGLSLEDMFTSGSGGAGS